MKHQNSKGVKTVVLLAVMALILSVCSGGQNERDSTENSPLISNQQEEAGKQEEEEPTPKEPELGQGSKLYS